MKTILFILLLFCTGIAYSQTRVYHNCYYKKLANKKETDTRNDVSIMWDDNDASTIDNINYVQFPDGYIIPITTPETDGYDNHGNPMFKFMAQDEGKRDVTCYITKYSKRDIAITIAYSSKLIYSMLINVFEYTEQ